MAIAKQNFNRGGQIISPLSQFGQQLGQLSQQLIAQRGQEEALKLRQAQEGRAVEKFALDKAEQDRITKERIATREGLRGLVPDGADLPQGSDIGSILSTKNALYNQRVKTPGTPEYLAAEKGELDLFKRKKTIESGFATPKDGRTSNQKNYEFLLSQGATPAEALKTAFGKGKGTGSNVAKANTNISKLIGSVGNPKDVQKAMSRAKALGIPAPEFHNTLLQAGGASLDDKDFFDFGNKDLDLSAINKALERMENSGIIIPPKEDKPVVVEKPKKVKKSNPNRPLLSISGKPIITSGDAEDPIGSFDTFIRGLNLGN